MPKYLFLLRDDGSSMADLSPEEIQTIIGRYRAWMGKVNAGGHNLTGDKLRDEQGRVLRTNSGRVVMTDGPFAEAKEIVGGFFLLEAASYEEAVALARDCPQVATGSVEVREIETD